MESNKSVTAVEWLVGKILTKDEIYDDYGNVIGYKLINTFTSSEDFSKYVEQAKAMDEKNLKDSFIAGAEMGEMFNNENRCFVSDAEKYLKETFKSK